MNKCGRCNAWIKGKADKMVFIVNGKPKWKMLCSKCYKEMLEKMGEKRTPKQYKEEVNYTIGDSDKWKGQW